MVNWKKFGARLAQGGLIIGILYTIWGMFSLGYDVALVNFHAGLFLVITGAITMTMLVSGVAVINDSIKGE